MYLRATISQKRLNSLLIMSHERVLMKKTEFATILKDFAETIIFSHNKNALF